MPRVLLRWVARCGQLCLLAGSVTTVTIDTLYLSNYRFGYYKTSLSPICDWLSCLPKLEVVAFLSCWLIDRDIKNYLYTVLEKNDKIQSVVLRGNCITTECALWLVDQLSGKSVT